VIGLNSDKEHCSNLFTLWNSYLIYDCSWSIFVIIKVFTNQVWWVEFTICYKNGSIQELVKFAKYSRHHWCNSNPHPKVKSSCSYNKILVLQIKGIQYAVACHCWPQEKIHWHFRGDTKVYEWCKSFLFVFNLL
jgi:hypothetical protein